MHFAQGWGRRFVALPPRHFDPVMPETITLDVLLDSAAGPLMAHWLDLRTQRGGGVPLRRQVEPAAIVPLLSCIYVCAREGGLVRYRLAGAGIEQVLGMSVRGRSLPEIFGDLPALGVVTGIYNTVMDGPAIAFGRGQVYVRLGRIGFGTRLILPLSSDGSAIDMLIGVTVPEVERRIGVGEITDGRQNTSVVALRDLPGLSWSEP